MYHALAGGPGGSGVNLARVHAKNIQLIVDSPVDPNEEDQGHVIESTEKYFDIVSFDPRGVGFTTPNFICFPGAIQRAYWQVTSDTEGLLGSSDTIFHLTWARRKALADACYMTMAKDKNGNDALGPYMSTPDVARDLAAIVKSMPLSPDLHSPLGCSGGCERQNPINEDHDSHRTLQYWGFSYGTLLGQTFASMYPHLVGRMVLDGVVDSPRHYNGRWRKVFKQNCC